MAVERAVCLDGFRVLGISAVIENYSVGSGILTGASTVLLASLSAPVATTADAGEFRLRARVDCSIPDGYRKIAILAIIGHVRGHATFQQIGTDTREGKGWARELIQLLQSEPDRYPILLDVIRSGAFRQKVDGAFEFGLDCILDGIRARASRRSR